MIKSKPTHWMDPGDLLSLNTHLKLHEKWPEMGDTTEKFRFLTAALAGEAGEANDELLG